MKTYDERFMDISARITKRRKLKTGIATSCVTMALVVLSLVLFTPYQTGAPDVSLYANSPYYSVIQKLNEANYVPPEHSNNFEAIADVVGDVSLRYFANSSTAEDFINGATSEGGEYAEVTDNQVAGVIESDIIKRSSQYIYYLRGTSLSVYTIAGESSEMMGSCLIDGQELKTESENDEDFSYYDSAEMYLSQDCTTVTVVLDGYHSQIGSCTVLINLDVTDPANISETGRVYITGSGLSSRMVDGDILLMSKFRVSADCDFGVESTFLPQVGLPGAMTSVAAEDIFSPEELTSTQYTTVCRIDGKTLEVQSSAAFLSYSDEVYVSADNVYASRSYTEAGENGGSRTMTEISCLNYSGKELEYLGSVTLAGSLKNQYSMDEYEGVLRVVTSTNTTVTAYSSDGEMISASRRRSASLYCVSLEDFSVIASVENFAPENEQAESVRFDGDFAYVCTAEIIELTDPVFFFDLSDLENITYTDTGTIDGYSSSLINFGEGYLLGVGYSGTGGLKVEIYEETDDRVVSVCAYEKEATFPEEYKSYLIDREKDLIGLGMDQWDGSRGYALLHFDGYELNCVAWVDMAGALSQMRGVLIDGWLYVFGQGFAVEKVW